MPVFPLIPVAAIMLIAGGATVLFWYKNLSKSDQEIANSDFIEMAQSLYKRPFNSLNPLQKYKVMKRVKKDHEA